MGNEFDLIVLGAGPGGYVAAIKAAKLGLETAVVEERQVGGICLNRGCIPAKAMIHASSLYQEAKNGEPFGVLAERVRFDYGKMLSYKEETTEKLVQGVTQLLKGNGVTLISGMGSLLANRQVQVVSEEGTHVYSAKHIILATGSVPVKLPLPGMDLPGVLTSDELFQLTEAPKSLVIIGGGVISVEFATIYAALGCRVTILEAMPRLLPNMEKEISRNLAMILKKRGVEVHTSAAVQSVREENGQCLCVFTEKEKEMTAAGQYVLCAVGRRPDTEKLFTEGTSPAMEGGQILVDENFRTSLDEVYAIGDLIPGIQLAHAASAQGIAVAEHLAGKEPSQDVSVIPACVYTSPEIACVGMTEDEANAKGIPAKSAKYIMSANGKSLITKEERGFIKVVVERETDVILGAQMMCARATDMIGEFATAVACRLTVAQLSRSMRAHPTYNEGVGEALEELEGGAIHVMPRKKR